MPQNRKVPFSGKKKKEQMLQKRHAKGQHRGYFQSATDEGDTTEDTEIRSRKLMEQRPNRGGVVRNKNLNRYNLHFFQESKKDLEQMRLEGFKPLKALGAQDREIGADFFENFNFPVRPEWDYNTKKEILDMNENRYFREYVEQIQKSHVNDNKELSLFELNLETWRQLWRVLEMSDILLIIVDVRFSTLMFPPSLYNYILNTINKHAILVLNKVDLVAPEAVVAWRQYFANRYPGLPIVLFSSYPARPQKGHTNKRLAHKRCMEGVYNIYRECQKITQSQVDVTAWETKILEDMELDGNYFDEDHVAEASQINDCESDEMRTKQEEPHVMYREGVLTVGCIGFPNVGKSSLINALKGKKVVSVSRTPGHTKHFQTIFLTNSVRLCDCPGLVFPSCTPKHLQVLLGSFPISQLQVPYPALKFLAEHINLPQLLKMHLPEDFDEWSAVAIADAWALKRGFLTAKAARPDRYRAANHLLRMSLAGQQLIVLQFYPPKFEEEKEKLSSADIDEVKKYQNAEMEEIDGNDTSSINSESEDSDISSSNDETNADEEEERSSKFKSRNTFSILEDK